MKRVAIFPVAAALASSPVLSAEPPTALDSDIVALVREVSPTRLESHVRTLVGFGTRHTLSSTDDPKRGIGAARRWIRDTLQKCADDSGGRLKVEFDEFVHFPTPRVPQPTPIVNVVATLEGRIRRRRTARLSCRAITTRCAAT